MEAFNILLGNANMHQQLADTWHGFWDAFSQTWNLFWGAFSLAWNEFVWPWIRRNGEVILTIFLILIEAATCSLDFASRHMPKLSFVSLALSFTLLVPSMVTWVGITLKEHTLEDNLRFIASIFIFVFSFIQVCFQAVGKNISNPPLSVVGLVLSISAFVFHFILKGKPTHIHCQGQTYKLVTLPKQYMAAPNAGNGEIRVYICGCAPQPHQEQAPPQDQIDPQEPAPPQDQIDPQELD